MDVIIHNKVLSGVGWWNKFSMYENMYWSSSLRPNVMVWLWMRHRQVSPWASSKLHGTGLKGGGLMGDDEKCSSRCVMGDNERVIPRDAFSRV